MNHVYEKLSSIDFLSRSYTFKFLFIAFLGIHIPLIGLIVFILMSPESLSTASVLVLTLILTLAATAITLYVLNGLLSPLRKSRQALQSYRQQRILPTLPTRYKDEAGLLMQNIQFTITELNDLLEEKKDLTALLSHDLRIPLRNVKTLSTLLKQATDRESIEEIADMILESNEEQTKLLENILDILRQDHLFFSASQNIKVPTAEIIDDAIAAFAPVAQAKGIVFRKKVDYAGAIEVQPELFTQVLKNLTSNAIKFSFQGATITFYVYDKNGKVFIEVQDAGMGFEPAVAERLFDRFTKNGRKGTAGEPSTGIGLYLSRKIVQHHNGELRAFSDGAGKGSVFSICIN